MIMSDKLKTGIQSWRAGVAAAVTGAVLLFAGAATASGYDKVGKASWYGKRYHGRTTASGERFDMNALTAAHRRLPFGTLVRVTNLSNRRSLVVRINDRGPYARGRIIDLSRRAASLLGFRNMGVARVRVQAVRTVRTKHRSKWRQAQWNESKYREPNIESIRDSLARERIFQPVTLRPPGGM
jgi:rare lipoprotein A